MMSDAQFKNYLEDLQIQETIEEFDDHLDMNNPPIILNGQQQPHSFVLKNLSPHSYAVELIKWITKQ